MVARLTARNMDNLLSIERSSALDAEQAKLDERGSVFHPRLFGKPNGDAISVQLRKCFTHVTRGCQGGEHRKSRAPGAG
jgi:hypothetical protein